MKRLLTFVFLLFFKFLISQALIPEAAKIKAIYVKLAADTGNRVLQESYITAFPSNAKSFLKVFQTKTFDQLYEDYDKYLDLLDYCSLAFPGRVLSKCINVGKDLVWDADAVGQLQHMCVLLSGKYIRIFITDYKKL